MFNAQSAMTVIRELCISDYPDAKKENLEDEKEGGGGRFM